MVRPHPAVRTLLLTKGEITAVVLDERTWQRHVLGAAPAAVWGLLDEPRMFDELVEDLVTTFDLGRDEAASAVDDATRTFRRLGILTGDENHDRAEPELPATPDDVSPLPRDHDP